MATAEHRWRRVARTAGLALAVVASLAAFPGETPWMIAFWLVWGTIRLLRSRGAWGPLAACSLLLLAKRVPWTPGLGLLAGIALSCLVAGWLAGKSENARAVRGIAWLEAAVLWIAWAAMAFDWYSAAHGPRGVEIARGRPVVCLGDSMTSMGPPHGGYPEVLAGLVTIPVVNLGQPGITTRQAIGLLDRLVAADPQVVVLELGGNDFVQGQSRQAVKENLEQIIVACRERGAEVILMEVPRGFFSDPYWGLERQLARQYRLELIPDTAIRRLLLSSPTMPPGQWTSGPFLTQDDGLHPNARGNRLLAEYVATALKRRYGRSIVPDAAE
jgi:lysophospholipase L1-like esterase